MKQNILTVKNLSSDYIKEHLSLGELLPYKEICERLNIPYCSGNQKKAQIKELKRYIDFDTIDRKWLITEIYSIPLPEGIRAVPDNSIYIKYVECILLKYLSTQQGNEAYITKNQLWLLLGMINDNYVFYKYKYQDLKDTNEQMTFFEVNNFYQRSNSYLSKIISNSLKSLERRYLITYNEIYMINIYAQDGIPYQCFEASVDETEKILIAKRKILLEFGLVDEKQLLFQNAKFKANFYSAFDRTIKEMYGWDKVYKSYHIIYNQKNAIEALTQDQIELERMTLNEKVIDKLNTQAKALVEDNKKNNSNNRNKLAEKNKDIFTYPESYVEVQTLLSERLLRIRNLTNQN